MNQQPTALQALVVRALTLTLIIVIPLGAIFLLNRNQTNNRLHDNVDAIHREQAVRDSSVQRIRVLTLHFNNIQRWVQFDNCVADEKQDAVIVSILRTIPAAERSPEIQDGIDALEPTDGTDRVCTPPSGERPPEAAP